MRKSIAVIVIFALSGLTTAFASGSGALSESQLMQIQGGLSWECAIAAATAGALAVTLVATGAWTAAAALLAECGAACMGLALILYDCYFD